METWQKGRSQARGATLGACLLEQREKEVCCRAAVRVYASGKGAIAAGEKAMFINMLLIH